MKWLGSIHVLFDIRQRISDQEEGGKEARVMLCKMKKMKKYYKRYANISQTKYCTSKDDKITQRKEVKNK